MIQEHPASLTATPLLPILQGRCPAAPLACIRAGPTAAACGEAGPGSRHLWTMTRRRRERRRVRASGARLARTPPALSRSASCHATCPRAAHVLLLLPWLLPLLLLRLLPLLLLRPESGPLWMVLLLTSAAAPLSIEAGASKPTSIERVALQLLHTICSSIPSAAPSYHLQLHTICSSFIPSAAPSYHLQLLHTIFSFITSSAPLTKPIRRAMQTRLRIASYCKLLQAIASYCKLQAMQTPLEACNTLGRESNPS